MTIEFLDSIHFTVVSASDPNAPLCPGWLTESEATALANDLIDCTGLDFIVVDAREMSDQS